MKKVLSLILVACMAFSCLALSACVWEGIFGTTTSTVPTTSTTQPTTKPTTSTTTATTTTTTTTIPDDGGEPEDLVIQHGDNFTEEDIEFVKSLHGTQPSWSFEYDLAPWSFSEDIKALKAGVASYHLIDIDIDSPYYICAYLDRSLDYDMIIHAPLDTTLFTWYKYYSYDDIQNSIGEHTLTDVFLLYDAVVLNDIPNDLITSLGCKYYIRVVDDKDLYRTPSRLLKLEYCRNMKTDEPLFLEESINQSEQRVYVNSNGAQYYVLLSKIYNESDNSTVSFIEDTLGNYYDWISPHLIDLDNLKELKSDLNGNSITYYYVGFDLTLLENIEIDGE